MKVKNLIPAAALAPLALACGQEASVQNVPSRPNVIFIMADDLGIGDLGCYGQRQIKTPGIDSIAREGLIFENHYAGSTVSAPSRAVLMTGLHTGHASIRGNKGDRDSLLKTHFDYPLSTADKTVGEVFKSRLLSKLVSLRLRVDERARIASVEKNERVERGNF